MILEDYIVADQEEIFGKDGTYIPTMKKAVIGTQGGSSIVIENGQFKAYDSSGNLIVLIDPNG